MTSSIAKVTRKPQICRIQYMSGMFVADFYRFRNFGKMFVKRQGVFGKKRTQKDTGNGILSGRGRACSPTQCVVLDISTRCVDQNNIVFLP